MNLMEKVAVVTGGSRGIGRAIALRLAREGALVVVNYQKNAEAAAVVVREIEAGGGRAFAVQGDVGSVPEIRRFFEKLDAELTARRGDLRFDILVNNAGVYADGNVAATTEADFDRVISVNVKGPFFVTQQALPRLRDGGRIINISSAVTRFPGPNFSVYSMSKVALNALTNILAIELGPRGITVNAVGPGLTETDMAAPLTTDPQAVAAFNSQTALGRIGKPEDIAAVVAFVASGDAAWVSGQYLEASGGLKLA